MIGIVSASVFQNHPQRYENIKLTPQRTTKNLSSRVVSINKSINQRYTNL